MLHECAPNIMQRKISKQVTAIKRHGKPTSPKRTIDIVRERVA